MSKPRVGLLTMLLFLLYPERVEAQQLCWELMNGPEGGWVQTSVVTETGEIIVGTRAGDSEGQTC